MEAVSDTCSFRHNLDAQDNLQLAQVYLFVHKLYIKKGALCRRLANWKNATHLYWNVQITYMPRNVGVLYTRRKICIIYKRI